MKRRGLILLAILVSWFLGARSGMAETKGYIDNTPNTLTYKGVVGAHYTGAVLYGTAISGIATNPYGKNTYGGFFETKSNGGAGLYAEASNKYTAAKGIMGVSRGDYGIGVFGGALSLTGPTAGGMFISDSISGIGVEGLARLNTGSTFGGLFTNHSTNGIGVKGQVFAETGNTYGGYFTNSSSSGIGAYGVAESTAGYTSGGEFLSKSTSGRGVRGTASAATGVNYGGQFTSFSTSGRGVQGVATGKTGETYGGYFVNYSTSGGAAVSGRSYANTGAAYGGYFSSGSTTGRAVYGLATSNYTTSANYGGYFQSKGALGKGVYGYASAPSGNTCGVYGQAASPAGYGVYSKGHMKVEGNQTVTGIKSAVVKVKDGKKVLLYAVEAAENWFEDFGSAKLREGSALVKIEATFAETVNTGMEYHVFLTPNGDCRGLYVANRTGASFEVRELNGGKSDISFSYRIVAKRKGYEDQRLAKVDEEKLTAMGEPEAETMQRVEVTKLALRAE